MPNMFDFLQTELGGIEGGSIRNEIFSEAYKESRNLIETNLEKATFVSGQIIQGKWKLGPCFATGSFGEVYIAIGGDIKPFIVKMESNELDVGEESTLLNEKRAYDILNAPREEGVGFPNTYFFGDEGIDTVLVMDCLGISIHEYVSKFEGGLSPRSALLLAIQAFERLSFVHSKGLLHLDIKPDNFLFGYEKMEYLYLIDFGNAKKFIDEKTGRHIPLIETGNLVGTPDFLSLNGHLGIQLSRRDDLESLGFLIVYLFNGSLPWMRAKNEDEAELVTDIYCSKLETSVTTLCRGLPNEIREYFDYVRDLSFDQSPDYELLRGKLQGAAKSVGL